MEVKERKYPRILVGKGIQNFSKISGIDAYWPDGKKTGVIDVSYIGAAVISPKEPARDLSKGQKVKLEFHFLENNLRVPFDCEVVRQDDRCVAFHFPELNISARQALQKFMHSKMIGLNMRFVDPKHYIQEQGFNYWFHGPNQTNVFIWGDKKRIKRVTVELDSRVLNFDHNTFFESKSANYLFAATEDYAHQVNNAEEKKTLDVSDAFVKQIVSFLAQIPDSKGVIERVLVEMSTGSSN